MSAEYESLPSFVKGKNALTDHIITCLLRLAGYYVETCKIIHLFIQTLYEKCIVSLDTKCEMSG